MPTTAPTLNPVATPEGTGTTRASGAQASATDGLTSSDFETFLLMLTTQLQNQDPLNPIESQDFAVQLATFSGVEQQVRTNELLETLAGGLGAQGLSQLAGWVGMEARVEAPVTFNGAPVEIAITPDPGSDAAELIVSDQFGSEVARSALPLGVQSAQWAGIDASGLPLPAGSYDLSIASLNQGVVTSTRPVPHYARVQEARLGSDGVELIVTGGTAVPAESVSALRDPAG